MIYLQPDHMVSKKSFTLLVDTGTIPIFTVFSIIFEHDCSLGIEHRLIRIGNAKESLTQIVRFNSYTFEFIVRKLKRSNATSGS